MQACLRIPSQTLKTRLLLSNAHPGAAIRGRLPLLHLHLGKPGIYGLTAESWNVSWCGYRRSWTASGSGGISRRRRLRDSETHCAIISQAEKHVPKRTHFGEIPLHSYSVQRRAPETCSRECSRDNEGLLLLTMATCDREQTSAVELDFAALATSPGSGRSLSASPSSSRDRSSPGSYRYNDSPRSSPNSGRGHSRSPSPYARQQADARGREGYLSWRTSPPRSRQVSPSRRCA